MADNRLKQTAEANADFLNLYRKNSFSVQLLHATILLSCAFLASCQAGMPPTEISAAPSLGMNVAAGEKSSTKEKIQNGMSKATIESIVRAVMNDQYDSHYNAKYDCWAYKAGDSAAYCMKPSQTNLVDSRVGMVLYFYAANRTDINDDPQYSFGHAEPGIMGAFKLSIDKSGGWKYLSESNAMTFGSFGYCGCDHATFIKIGNNDDYGWQFASGGVWQGYLVSHHNIVAPHGSEFKDLSNIPEIREDDQDSKYQIKIIESSESENLFPILVKKVEKGSKPKETTIYFDKVNSIFSLPDNF